MLQNLEVALSKLQAAEQAVPPSLTFPHKGGGNGESRALDEANTDGASGEAEGGL